MGKTDVSLCVFEPNYVCLIRQGSATCGPKYYLVFIMKYGQDLSLQFQYNLQALPVVQIDNIFV